MLSDNKNTKVELIKENSLVRIQEIKDIEISRIPTGIDSLDEFFGTNSESKASGIPYPAVSLIGGERGIGKTRLFGKIASIISDPEWTNEVILFIEMEAPLEQFKQWTGKTIHPNAEFYCLNAKSIESHIKKIEEIKPKLVIFDSFQEIMECSTQEGQQETLEKITTASRENNCHCAIISQMTKNGDISGSNNLQHKVDICITLYGEKKNKNYFYMESSKNRYGKPNKLTFTHSENGPQILN